MSHAAIKFTGVFVVGRIQIYLISIVMLQTKLVLNYLDFIYARVIIL